jgi:hypothetical protein
MLRPRLTVKPKRRQHNAVSRSWRLVFNDFVNAPRQTRLQLPRIQRILTTTLAAAAAVRSQAVTMSLCTVTAVQ